ncbi:MAG: acetyl-CoA carboxylase biotin carboxyl carrier protein [Pseudomonadota bacterium]
MTKTTEEDVAFIRALAAILKECDLTEVEVTRDYGDDDELKVKLSRAMPAAAAVSMPQPAPQLATSAAPAPAPEPRAAVPAPPQDRSDAVTSPMVGTAYLSPEPGAAPFVQIGDTVTEGQTVLIIEAMKTMNQIPASRSGKVTQILVANAEPVEFGAALMIIE